MADLNDPDNIIVLEELGEEEVLTVEGATEHDLLFPVIPLEDDPSPPDGDPDDLVDDLADFALDEEDDPTDEPGIGETGIDWAYDWDRDEFHSGVDGSPFAVEGNPAVAEWAIKALNTPRGHYAIYSNEYGSELHRLIGAGLPGEHLHAEVTRTVEECLLRHPRIEDVDVEDMVQSGDVLFLTVSLFLDTDDDPVLLEVRA